jgi:hypothetical protein
MTNWTLDGDDEDEEIVTPFNDIDPELGTSIGEGGDHEPQDL